MSPRLPRVTAEELLRALERDGWYIHHQSGGHCQLKHPDKPGRRVTLQRHRMEVWPWLLTRILDQAGMTAEELRRLL